MTDVFDYLKWRGDLPFSADPPNAVDALIFSALAYIRYRDPDSPARGEAPSLREAAEEFFTGTDLVSKVRVRKDLDLLKAAAASRRFGSCGLSDFVETVIPEEETQFAAVTFLLDDGSAFLSFRGTDDSLIGWKEDFNMSFRTTVPAQQLALEYTRAFASGHMLPLRLGGHSKGGNLAVFAAAKCGASVQRRILEIYNNDGPGFTEHMMEDPGYIRTVPKIRTFVPQSSVIGMLLEHEESYTVVKSNQVSILQHELYSWEVLGKSFVIMEAITDDSRFLDMTIKNWIAEMTPQERNVLVDTLFDLLASGDVESALDIFHIKNVRHYLKALSENGNMRKLFTHELRSLVTAARKARAEFDIPKDDLLP